jgi:hypothetical protein
MTTRCDLGGCEPDISPRGHGSFCIPLKIQEH